MSKQIQIPDIGSDEVTVTEVMVNVGDTISVDQSIINVEGDKASMEVPAPEAGVVKEILVKVGDKVSTGTPMLVLEAAGAAPAADEPTAPVADAPTAPVVATAPTASAIVEVNVPDIGGDEVNVTEIMVAVGDTITEEQSLITVEGDKASMEVPAPFGGVVKEILVKSGDKVSTGSLIMRFEVLGAAPAASASTSAPQTAAPATTAQAPQAAAPATTAQAPQAAAPDTTAQAAQSNNNVSGLSQEQVEASTGYAHATPVIRRLAREFGVNLDKVKGTGRKGRIVKEDIEAYVKTAVKAYESGATAQATGNGVANGAGLGLLPWPKVDFSKFGEIEEVELSRINKISGANLHRNWVIIPHVTHFDKADITDLEAFRKEQNALAEKQKLGVKITPVVFIMKAVAKALEAYPRFNSSITEDAQRLILKKYINIGVAVDTPNGLVVPVFKNVNKKGIIELSRELMEVSKKAREGKLTASDMQGGCFTISSLGGIGTTHFAPIVNAPEVAILGVSKSSMEPVWNGKEFAPRLILPMSLSFDHRVIDGADGARFISYLGSVLADLRRLVM
ncbi:TPA: pyruvate dehydrogenase complex dihydrolipoyllysine-residue acetyltransferase [Haemophilus influenzae]|uniref:pyruvate dehydrogenase complex dihydrolipoyllysine-residue acetyltransferase n=1 Tax=Haemophilus influenzae TaxID=727 RepID=UPI0005AF1678|nr:pyruvate dehydrogenase complex dihydrolipoyllysine-residue acetyltransferase [Haemophilus influenzae]KIP38873.1 dihydrolipoyllysine-residue acetyltransferase component of pyruvate dehydrogenase complex [Haemophilus influenzae]KIP40681.1 dihydrolipoyllysine-residue acetyltransferase component of pyruvate dehydrogenase complex [Haemophilus influenzae]KIP43290.1 dihydrolipoyllysine-residue acetyltransferase component of pyruvate dehydrogenase complex [Haemophilus influenzae]MCK8903064.1 pyruvat